VFRKTAESHSTMMLAEPPTQSKYRQARLGMVPSKRIAYESAQASRIQTEEQIIIDLQRASTKKQSSRSRQRPLNVAKSPVTKSSSPFVQTTIQSSRGITVPTSVKQTSRSEYGGHESAMSMRYVDSEQDRPLSNLGGAESYVMTSQRS